MPSATKKRPLMEPEAGEGKAHEMQESPDEEVREGSEPEESDTPPRARRRNRPMKDGDCASSGKPCSACSSGKPCSGKKGRTKKDAPMQGPGELYAPGRKADMGCGYGKRGDALTPQEYLAACDLGIQGRSRSYIRARLDAAERLDLKCGKGSISEGEKCHVGAAQKASFGQKAKTVGSSVAILGGLGINAAATGFAAGKAITGDFAAAGRAFQVAGGGQALMGVGARGLGLKTEANKLIGNAALTAGIGTVIREAHTGEINKALSKAKNSRLAKRMRYAPGNAVGRARIAAMRRKPMPKPRMKDGKIANPWLDSAWATGFSPELDQLAT